MISLSQETEALAQHIARATRMRVDDAIRAALEDKARAEGIALQAPATREASPDARAARIARFEEIARAAAALPVLDARTACEIADDINTNYMIGAASE